MIVIGRLLWTNRACYRSRSRPSWPELLIETDRASRPACQELWIEPDRARAPGPDHVAESPTTRSGGLHLRPNSAATRSRFLALCLKAPIAHSATDRPSWWSQECA